MREVGYSANWISGEVHVFLQYDQLTVFTPTGMRQREVMDCVDARRNVISYLFIFFGFPFSLTLSSNLRILSACAAKYNLSSRAPHQHIQLQVFVLSTPKPKQVIWRL